MLFAYFLAPGGFLHPVAAAGGASVSRTRALGVLHQRGCYHRLLAHGGELTCDTKGRQRGSESDGLYEKKKARYITVFVTSSLAELSTLSRGTFWPIKCTPPRPPSPIPPCPHVTKHFFFRSYNLRVSPIRQVDREMVEMYNLRTSHLWDCLCARTQITTKTKKKHMFFHNCKGMSQLKLCGTRLLRPGIGC